ncbi:MAG: hypothetical protein KTR15_07045 [Phycisphaeraceae bacterium]|nr:hypothetical protein [Phycisphaeraceae bacterium]
MRKRFNCLFTDAVVQELVRLIAFVLVDGADPQPDDRFVWKGFLQSRTAPFPFSNRDRPIAQTPYFHTKQASVTSGTEGAATYIANGRPGDAKPLIHAGIFNGLCLLNIPNP